MEVEMLHRLSAFLTSIGNDAEALFRNFEFSCKLWNHITHDMRNQFPILIPESKNALNMLFRDNQNMDRCLRLQIAERSYLIIFIDNI